MYRDTIIQSKRFACPMTVLFFKPTQYTFRLLFIWPMRYCTTSTASIFRYNYCPIFNFYETLKPLLNCLVIENSFIITSFSFPLKRINQQVKNGLHHIYQDYNAFALHIAVTLFSWKPTKKKIEIIIH
jgi:hypothetical protein